ncbi:MAG: zinc-ribbon domain-containing protein, partial [Clostridia bacterium]|nr:zinc-ribbon domain-containing protein [Clostridia bacterium]
MGYNDLSTLNPVLAKEWNHERNGVLKPENVLPNSDKKVWWKCDKGHEWQATISNRNKG